MPESLWESSCQVSDPGDGTPLPLHSFYLDRVCLYTQLQKEENPNNYHIPRSVARASKGGGGGWRDIRILVQFAERSRAQVPSSEVLMRLAWSTAPSGQCPPTPPFQSRVGASSTLTPLPAAKPSGSAPDCKLASGRGIQAFLSTWATPP